MRRTLLLLLLAATSVAHAQTTHYNLDTQLWPELQGELTFKNGDYLLVALRGQRVVSNSVYADRSLGFDARRATVAYEHFWNPHWSWGGTARLQGGPSPEGYGTSGGYFIPELLLRHRAPLVGGITFGQRLSAERTISTNGKNYLGDTSDGQFWGRLRLDVERLFPLGSDAAGIALRPRLSYEASTHLRFQKAANDPDERTIQFTSLRAEVGVRLSPAIDCTPWVARQTVYGQSLAQYDINGNQIYGGKINYITPTVGLDVRYTLLTRGAKAEHQQLPTQH